MMSAETVDSSSAFWLKYMSGAQRTHLPALSNQDGRSSTNNECFGSLEATTLGRRIPNEILLSSWALTLALYTWTEDVVFGLIAPHSDNEPRSSHGVVPCRLTSLGKDQRRKTTESTRRVLHDIARQNTLTLDKIQSLSSDIRSACQFGSILNVLPGQNGEMHANSVTKVGSCRNEPNQKLIDLAPVVVSCNWYEDSTTVTTCFNSRLYTRDFLSQIIGQFVLAINDLSGQDVVAANPVDLNLIATWTHPGEPVPSQQFLHQAFEQQSSLSPHKVAVGQTDSVMTYQELNTGAELLARHTITNTFQVDDGVANVAICFEKSAYAILSMVAALKAGCAYVPLDIEWPEQRFAEVLEDAQVKIVLCSKLQSARFRKDTYNVVIVDEEAMWKMKKSASSRHVNASLQIDRKPTDTAYILYTSGSTGKPKGISISHRAITTSVKAMTRRLKVTDQTRAFQTISFTFDLSVGDIWMVLSQGGRICLPSEHERSIPDVFISQERCNYTMITPSLASTIDPTILKDNLKTVSLVGEEVPRRLLLSISPNRDSSSAPAPAILNSWGPTEACVIASSSAGFFLDENRSLSADPNNIGYPIGSSIFVVSPTDPNCLMPPFAPGEIALVGNSLATSYYNNPEKTAEAFRENLTWTRDPKLRNKVGSGVAMDRVYLTGDIGRYNPNGDGTILYMQRKEGGFVKVNGYRVELEEIESRVHEAGKSFKPKSLFQKGICVLACEGLAGSEIPESELRQTLVCFFVSDNARALCNDSENSSPDQTDFSNAVKAVAEQLRTSLPEYMIPTLFVPVEKIPMTTSHKIDRKRLRRTVEGLGWDEAVKNFGR